METKWKKTWMDNRPSNLAQPRSSKHLSWIILGTILVFISVGVIIWLLCTRQSYETPETVKKQVTGQSQGAKHENSHVSGPRKKTSLAQKTSVRINEIEGIGERIKEKWLGIDIDHKTVTTNGQYILETIFTTDGKMHRYAHSSRPRIFNNTSDQVLALATSDPDGTAPLPGLGKNFEEDFIKSLNSEIVINSDDSPEVRKIKENVILARKNLLAAIEEGQSAEDVIRMDREAKLQTSELRNIAVRGLHIYLEKGDEEGAALYLETMNKKLEEMGLMKLELPKRKGR